MASFLSHLLSFSSKVIVKPNEKIDPGPETETETETKRSAIGLLCFGSNLLAKHNKASKNEDKKKRKYGYCKNNDNASYSYSYSYSSAKGRMHNELFKSSLNVNKVSHCCYGPVDDDDPLRLQGIIVGPSDTPFAGGVFFLTIQIPSDYPYKPPKIKFRTKVFHPNVGRDGTIHIDILSYNWSPTQTIDKLLLSICSFLADPNHEQDSCSSVCNLYWNHRNLYNKIAREWTRKYAMI